MELFDKSTIEKEIKELPSGILTIILEAACSVNITSIAIVGGVVRDLIKKSKNQDYEIIFNDLDLIIEGETSTYIKELQKVLGAERVKVIRDNRNYKTSEVIINGIKVDIASARKETYPIPGENPIVELSTIKKDLIRRDFNINAMAIELKDNRLIDLFSGLILLALLSSSRPCASWILRVPACGSSRARAVQQPWGRKGSARP